MKIKEIRLLDIQSWNAESPTLKLSNECTNVIIAPSETGKSVLIKVLKEMCFPFKWGYAREGLIRRGCQKGMALFKLENNDTVVFEMYLKTQNYYLVHQNAEEQLENKMWGGESEIPAELEDLMGLIIDRKAKTVINVIDKTMPMPLINTDPKLSGRIVATVTEDKNLEAIKSNITNWLEELRPLKSALSGRMEAHKRVYDNAPSIDVNALKKQQYITQIYLNLFDQLEPAMYDMKSLRQVKKPDKVEDLEIDECMQALNLSEKLFSSFKRLNDLIENHKTMQTYSEDDLRVMIYHTKIIHFLDSLKQLQNLEQPKHYEDLSYITQSLKCKVILMKIVKLSKELENKPTVIQDNDNIHTIIKLKQINLLKSLRELEQLKDTLNQTITKRKNAEVALREFENEAGICPLCGNKIGKEV